MNCRCRTITRLLLWSAALTMPYELWAFQPPTTNTATDLSDVDQDAESNETNQRQPWQRGSFRPDSSREQWPARKPIENGWVFLNGKYLAPPYTIESTADNMSINGHVLPQELSERFSGRRMGSGWFGRGRGEMPGWSNRAFFNDYGLRSFLNDSNGILLTWEGMSTAFLSGNKVGLELLEILSGRTEAPPAESPWILQVPEKSRPAVLALIKEFKATDEFKDRAIPVIEESLTFEAAAIRQIAAVRRLESWNYFLSIFAMVLCAGAFGHLIKSHPSFNSSPEPSTAVRNQIYISLGLAGLFSLHDLILTLLAIDAGAMRETNPIAAELVHNPILLAAYKIVLTLFALGVMAVFWKQRIAQTASWWTCLVLTLLTARWLIVGALMA